MIIRDATEHDLPAILDIHNDAILHGTAIWDEQPVDLDERQNWYLQRRRDALPVLVADADGEFAGYASYGPFRAKSGFRFTVEHSVYVHPNFYRRGVATLLMVDLIERARVADLHVMVAAIESRNVTSIDLHRKLGFVHVGELPEVGLKFGEWMNLTYMQLML